MNLFVMINKINHQFCKQQGWKRQVQVA